jgi:hypothetical protein
MLPLFIYILKAILISGILLGYYWIGLRNTKFHYYNRFYLVGAVLLSLNLPLLDLEWFILSTPESAPVQQVVQFMYQSDGAFAVKQGLTWDQVLFICLALVSASLIILFAVGVFKVYLLKSKGKVTVMERFDFIETALDEAPFSFFRNLFWRKDLPVHDETGQRILKHELTHIEQYHSYDKLFVAFTTYLFWMNPFYWLIRKELEVVHEFIADEEAVAGEDAAVLAEMLLKAHYHSNSLSIGQSFFYSSIKRRIIMLTSSKKVSYSYARRILVLPVALAIVALLSFTIKDQLDQNDQSQLTKESILQDQIDSIPAKYRDPKTGKIKGSFQIDIDGDIATFKDVKSKKKLFEVPLSELGGNKPKDRIEMVFAEEMVLSDPKASRLPMDKSSKLIFEADSPSPVVIINGKEVSPADLKTMDPSSIKSIDIREREQAAKSTSSPVIIINGKEVSPADLNAIDPSTIKTVDIRKADKGAKSSSFKIVKVDANGSKTEPGMQVISIKVDSANYAGSMVVVRASDDQVAEKKENDPTALTFTTTGEDGKKTITYVQKTTTKTELPKDVLYMLDGKEISRDQMNGISPDKIQSINVLKGENATGKYGDKGKNGVIEIKTKQ